MFNSFPFIIINSELCTYHSMTSFLIMCLYIFLQFWEKLCTSVVISVNRYLKKCKNCFCPYNEIWLTNGYIDIWLFWSPLTSIIWTKTAETFFKISSFVFYRRQTAYKFGMTRGWISPAEKTIETFTELVIVTVHTTGRNEEHADEDKLQINSL